MNSKTESQKDGNENENEAIILIPSTKAPESKKQDQAIILIPSTKVPELKKQKSGESENHETNNETKKSQK